MLMRTNTEACIKHSTLYKLIFWLSATFTFTTNQSDSVVKVQRTATFRAQDDPTDTSGPEIPNCNELGVDPLVSLRSILSHPLLGTPFVVGNEGRRVWLSTLKYIVGLRLICILTLGT